MANKSPTKAQVAEFEMLWPILRSLLNETKELSKKKADNPLNKLKVGMINKILVRLKEILSDDPSVEFLEVLDSDILPSNSDAVFIIAQYDSAMKQFHDKHQRYDSRSSSYKWVTID
jgi:hypothetical protein